MIPFNKLAAFLTQALRQIELQQPAYVLYALLNKHIANNLHGKRNSDIQLSSVARWSYTTAANLEGVTYMDCSMLEDGCINIGNPQDFDHLIEKYGAERVIPRLAIDFWSKPSTLVNRIDGAKSLQPISNETNSVAIFFHSLGIGGGERVTRDLTRLWLDMGKEVLLITNKEPEINDYALPSQVKRVVIPSFFHYGRETYWTRGKALRETLIDNKVDYVVFAHWFSEALTFDLLTIRTLGIPVQLFIQTSFTQFFLDKDLPSIHADLPLQYKLATGIICLSELDALFWIHFNSNIRVAQNPITCPVTKTAAPLSGHTVLWPARVAPDKCPVKALYIMAELVKMIPDAQLLMVGPIDPGYEEVILQKAHELNVTKHIQLCGPQIEGAMGRWYEKSDAFLLTSRREGWCLALGEALAHGLPCVSFDLPNLTLAEQNPAVLTIEQDNYKAAAKALAQVLIDKNLAHAMGEKGRQKIAALSNWDYRGFWLDVFQNAQLDSKRLISNGSRESRLWSELLSTYRQHLSDIENETASLHVTLNGCQEAIHDKDALIHELEDTISKIEGSISFRLGRALTKPLRAIRDLFLH